MLLATSLAKKKNTILKYIFLNSKCYWRLHLAGLHGPSPSCGVPSG